jgi:putative flippase GtrA
VAGVIGFCLDGGLLTILLRQGWDVIPSRLLSFSAAVSATWLLNRLWTFARRNVGNIGREYANYFGTQVLGAIINLSIFFALIGLLPDLREVAIVPLAFGAAVSLAFNYLVSKHYVFAEQH